MLVSVRLVTEPSEGNYGVHEREVEVARGCHLDLLPDALGGCLADALVALLSPDEVREALTTMTTDVHDALGDSEDMQDALGDSE